EIEKLLSVHQELNRSSLTAAQRMNRLLERLRHFSHLDRSATQSIDLNAELLKSLEMVKSETQAVVQVETHLNPLPELLCQPQKLGIAFANLLRNAFQAVGEDGIIRVSTDHSDENISNHHVEVLIEDNGRGIDPAELKTIFDPKFVPQSGKVKTSWGLAISQQILLQHGGQLLLKSTLGQGTIAKIILPVREQVELNSKASAAGILSGYNSKVLP
ncbi:MAG: ATP-binding protein, partial [Pyrinomonadaceae bacterium]